MCCIYLTRLLEQHLHKPQSRQPRVRAASAWDITAPLQVMHYPDLERLWNFMPNSTVVPWKIRAAQGDSSSAFHGQKRWPLQWCPNHQKVFKETWSSYCMDFKALEKSDQCSFCKTLQILCMICEAQYQFSLLVQYPQHLYPAKLSWLWWEEGLLNLILYSKLYYGKRLPGRQMSHKEFLKASWKYDIFTNMLEFRTMIDYNGEGAFFRHTVPTIDHPLH